MYGFAHFTQRKDASSKRGYEQVIKFFIFLARDLPDALP
jgi:hypothetical protein